MRRIQEFPEKEDTNLELLFPTTVIRAIIRVTESKDITRLSH